MAVKQGRTSLTGEPAEEIPPAVHLAEADVGWVIARRVRELRVDLGLTIGQLADRSDISKGMLSKIENAQASPSLNTLVKLAVATSVPMTSFFRGLEEEHGAVLVKAGEGIDIVRKGSHAGHRYQFLGGVRGAQRLMEPLLVTLSHKEEVFPLFQHEGIEFLYVLDGVLEYGFGAERYELHAGDGLQFDGEVAHGPARLVETPVRFLSIIAHGALPHR